MRESKPLVSVIMPAYNSEKYIGEAIESILNQTFDDFELIVIDDCCTDKTAEVVKQFEDDRIVFVQNKVNKGFLYGLNYGIEIAKGKYIARLDDDDISYPSRLQKQVDYLNTHDNVVLVGARIDRNVDGIIREQDITPVKTSNQIRFELLFENNSIAHSSFMMRKDVLDKFNVKYEIFKQVPDYHMLTCICKYGDLACLEETLVTYRIHPQQSTNIRSKRMRMDEFDNARCMYIESLPLLNEYKVILKKFVCRDLNGKQDCIDFQQAFEAYMDMCMLKKDSIEDNQCCQYVLREELIQQKHNWNLLKYYLGNEFKDRKWLCTRKGVKFVIKCIIGYNKNWFSTTIDYKNNHGDLYEV